MKQKSRKIIVPIIKAEHTEFPLSDAFEGLIVKKIRNLTPEERDDNFRCSNMPIMIELSNGGKIQAFTGALTIPCDTIWDNDLRTYRKMTKDEMNNEHFKGKTNRIVNSIDDLIKE